MLENKKFVLFSFDDADIYDRRTVKDFERHGIKGTFNINSENIGVLSNKFTAEEIVKVYAGHEAAAHTLTHPNLVYVDQKEIIRQVEQDRKNLEELFGYPIIGLAYPGDGRENINDFVVDTVRECTGIRYARAGNRHKNSFSLPDDFLCWYPTCHVLAPNALELADKFISIKTDKPQIFFVWGHSYELQNEEAYRFFTALLHKIGGRSDFTYLTCAELYRKVTQ